MSKNEQDHPFWRFKNPLQPCLHSCRSTCKGVNIDTKKVRQQDLRLQDVVNNKFAMKAILGCPTD